MSRIARTAEPIPPVVIDSITLVPGGDSTAALLFSGPAKSEDFARTLHLTAPRQQLVASVLQNAGRWTASVPLAAAHWGGPVMPARSGSYLLTVHSDDDSIVPLSVIAETPFAELIPGLSYVSFACTESGVTVDLAPALSDRERGPLQQASLEADYRSTSYTPVNAVFFESFFGQIASCNPLAIDREIALKRPDIVRYWSVADSSVRVPEGAIALLEGSEDWWRARGASRLILVNDWLRKRYKKRSHQTVLQTWHGTMLKRLALGRRRLGVRSAIATLRERARWDILLAQNPYSRKIFRSSYAFRGTVWQEGYPRDDVLVNGTPTDLRARLGISDTAIVILYAPTWRDDHPDQVDHLDVARFAETLGDGYVTMIRGHSRTLRPGEDVRAPNVIDVTGYPDVSELFLVADALVTDYSSVMFDYTVTAKPILFFTPDLDHYQQTLRGFYFDLIPVAPGPVVSSMDDLASLIRDLDTVHARYTDRYDAWRARFNPRDDGRAAERVVQRLLSEGILH